MERDAFLAEVRAAMVRGDLPVAPEADPGPLLPDLEDVDLLALFSERVAAVDGHVHTGAPLEALTRIVEIHGAGPYLSWDAGQLPVAGAIDHLEALGCRRVDGAVPGDPDGRRAHQGGYVDLHLGLTGAEAAFAESGSLVVRSGPGRPRMASLVPLVHVAFLPADRLYRSQMHWMAAHGEGIADVANVVYVTGPSRTADIEQQLNLGVHGPREVHVVIV